jgi:hypothetical protein
LTQIEDIHLHHEAKICHNDMIIISDKKILCRTGREFCLFGNRVDDCDYPPGVTPLVGPVIGLVTQTSAKILVETDAITTISFNVFIIDGIAQAGQYLKIEVHDLRDMKFTLTFSAQFVDVYAHHPQVITLGDLSPGCRYAVYIGGVKAAGRPGCISAVYF